MHWNNFKRCYWQRNTWWPDCMPARCGPREHFCFLRSQYIFMVCQFAKCYSRKKAGENSMRCLNAELLFCFWTRFAPLFKRYIFWAHFSCCTITGCFVSVTLLTHILWQKAIVTACWAIKNCGTWRNKYSLAVENRHECNDCSEKMWM